MAQPVPIESRYTSERYFALVDAGLLGADDRVELLEGVIVAMSPQNPRHASATTRVYGALYDALGKRAVIRVQLPLVLSTYSVPEPDVAVVPGKASDYDAAHPTMALLVVEVAESSLAEDRLTKAAIYAAAKVPEFWIVNLRDECVEVFRGPDAQGRRYTGTRVVQRLERLEIVAFQGTVITVADLLPHR